MHILTDTMEIYIIEIKKFKKFKDTSNYKQLNSWIKFIESSDEEIDMSNKEIVKAKKMIKEKIPLETIHKITKIPLEDLKKFQKEI